MIDAYLFPRKYRSCLNCVHLRQEAYVVGHTSIGGCFVRMSKDGPPDLRHAYCGQWFLEQLPEEY